jgi:hypothetical protein
VTAHQEDLVGIGRDETVVSIDIHLNLFHQHLWVLLVEFGNSDMHARDACGFLIFYIVPWSLIAIDTS